MLCKVSRASGAFDAQGNANPPPPQRPYRQFFFLFSNVLLFITVASTLFKSQKDIFEDPTKIANIFASKLPEVAPFYINYTVLQGIML